jgi:hypothetical protein
MDRRELLKASLASAAAIRVTSKRAEADLEAALGADSHAEVGQDNQQPVLASVYDYEAAAKRKMSLLRGSTSIVARPMK